MGVKDPRATLLADFWSLVNEDLRFVVCLRNPLEVGLSLQRRGLMSPSLGMSLWAAYYERLLETTSRTRASSSTTTHWSPTRRRACPRSRRKLGVDPTEQQLRDSLALVDPVQRHHNAASPHSQFLPAAVTRLYARLLAEAANRPSPRGGGTRSRLPLPPSMVRMRAAHLSSSAISTNKRSR